MKREESTAGKRFTRRQLASAAAFGALAPGAAYAQGETGSELKAARDRSQRQRESIKKVKMAIATEPSFKFVP